MGWLLRVMHRTVRTMVRYWPFLHARRHRILLRGLRYCADPCFEIALRESLEEACRAPVRVAAHHRIPIGLLLVSRQQVTNAQLRTALAAQQEAGYGSIGEWLQRLGYASEEHVTAALARQWSCPVLRVETLEPRRRLPPIPLALMCWAQMLPVDFVDPTRTFHIAFAEGIDYSTLYAIEQMLDCRTEPCLATPSLLRRYFEQRSDSRWTRRSIV